MCVKDIIGNEENQQHYNTSSMAFRILRDQFFNSIEKESSALREAHIRSLLKLEEKLGLPSVVKSVVQPMLAQNGLDTRGPQSPPASTSFRVVTDPSPQSRPSFLARANLARAQTCFPQQGLYLNQSSPEVASLSCMRLGPLPSNNRINKAAANLGIELLREISKSDSRSYAISPVSIMGVLAMGVEIVKNKGDFLSKLNIQMSVEDFRDQCKSFLEESRLNNGNGLIEIFQAIAASEVGYIPMEVSAYLKAVYQSEVFTPVSGQTLREKVNAWCSEKTRTKIPKILNSDDVKIALLNAVYLKLSWQKPFEKSSPADFVVGIASEGGANILKNVPMMKLKDTLDVYKDVEGRFSMVKIPYQGSDKGDLSHLVFLPSLKEGESALVKVNEMQDLLNYDKISECMREAKPQKVDLKMPITKVETNVDLLELLKNKGLPLQDLIDHLKTKNLEISGVQHATFVQTNEQGSEAAAVTSIELEERGVCLATRFQVLHSFVSCIMKGDKILFISRVSDSSAF